jgi:hypothetical protein
MALNPTGIMSIGGPVVGSSINLELQLSATANSSLNQVNFRTLAGIPSGTIALSNFYGKAYSANTQRGVFAYGQNPAAQSMANYVTNTGVIGGDTATPAPAQNNAVGVTIGGDKGILLFGYPATASNLVSNTGVFAASQPYAGGTTQRALAVGATYGIDKGLVAYGLNPLLAPAPPPGNRYRLLQNLISNTGVIAADTACAASIRAYASGVKYGTDTAIICYGTNPTIPTSLCAESNLVSNTGVIASAIPIVGTRRWTAAATTYGGDKGIIAFGWTNSSSPGAQTNISNLISNTGVISANQPGVGTARGELAGCGYGGDKGIVAYGRSPINGARTNTVNLVSNTGTVAADSAGAGTARSSLSALGYSYT